MIYWVNKLITKQK